MVGVLAVIRRYVSDDQPGWVECALTDAHGKDWVFVEKVPVITAEPLDARSTYPRPVVLACEVVERRQDGGREVVVVDTERPWGIAATTGETRFEVRPEQLVPCGWPAASRHGR
jgi:hypothetical protein